MLEASFNNTYRDVLDDAMCEDEKFNPVYVEQILGARTRIFDEMCKATGTPDTEYNELCSAKFNARSVTKKMLADWLEAVCCIFDEYTTPVLANSLKTAADLDTMKDEKINDQKKIIDLQEKIIEKKEAELQSVKTVVQTTVQSEIKSYSSVLKNTCNKALAPRRMQAAMKTATEEDGRSKNLIIYGLEEKKEEKLEDEILEVLSHLDEKPRIVSCSRLGKDSTADKEPTKRNFQPIRVSLSGTDHVRQILNKTMRLRTVEGYTRVYICPDRSPDQRVSHKKLVEELKQKRISEPSKRHFIRNNSIFSCDT